MKSLAYIPKKDYKQSRRVCIAMTNQLYNMLEERAKKIMEEEDYTGGRLNIAELIRRYIDEGLTRDKRRDHNEANDKGKVTAKGEEND